MQQGLCAKKISQPKDIAHCLSDSSHDRVFFAAGNIVGVGLDFFQTKEKAIENNV